MNGRRRWARLLAVGAVTAVVASGAVLAHRTDATAAPGDPLTSFGSQGRLELGSPAGCSPCPNASSSTTAWFLRSAGALVVHGYVWATPPAPPTGTDPPARPATGSAVALWDGGTQVSHVAVTGGATEDVELLAVGYQPSPARIVAVVAIFQHGALVTDIPTRVRQEIRRYTTAGALSSTTSLPVASNGDWASATVAADGSVAAVENGSSGVADLPLDTVRRYGTDGTLQWSKTLASGDGVEAVRVSASGRVILAGEVATQADGAYDGLIAALTDAGALDPAFGTGGRIVVPAPAGVGRGFTQLDVVGEQVVAAGIDEWQPPEADDQADSEEGPGGLILVRADATGLVTSFGGDGVVEEIWLPGAGERTDPTGVALDGSQVLVAGFAQQSDAFGITGSLTRRSANGAIDGAFAVDGTVAQGFTALAPVSGGFLVATPTAFDPEPVTFGSTLRAYTSAAGPASGPPTPAAPTVASAVAGGATLSWAPVGGSPTGYDVLVDAKVDGKVDHTFATTTAGTSLSGLTAGTAYAFALRARNSSGLSARSAWSVVAVPPFATADAFTKRQYLDFAGRAATAAEVTTWRTGLSSGALTPAAAISQAVDFANWNPKQGPVIRLYQAYFGRLPDLGGLNYWTGRYRSGTTLAAISGGFAGSSELTNKYGSLTDKAFVQLVYQNVLGRPGDAGGVTYWTSQLSSGKKTRGEVMLGFSESGEYKTKTGPLVDVVGLHTGLLRRMPTAGEVAVWVPLVRAGGRSGLISSILGSAAYDSRIP